MKNIVTGIFILVVVCLLTTAVFFFFKTNDLKANVKQAQAMLQKMHEETKRIEEEKEKISKEKEKLQADVISYIGVNTTIQKEKEELEGKLKEALKASAKNESDLKRLKEKLQELDQKVAKGKPVDDEKIIQERRQLVEKIKSMEKTLQEERGTYHYNLAVAYTKANLNDEAIAAYEKSLELNPNNADAHYNLGLLYEKFKGDPDTATFHYNKYLELKPDAGDREEVLGWIEKIK